ncbi:MAG: helix-turn-helix domain-containing protein [Corynebacterium casei]|uniref:helix-turn-helix domain-containing protein n=1 Tax=Corynebacterium casei TaxID=160386 RepID=UPI003F9172F4
MKDDEIQENATRLIREWRRKKGLSQSELAEQLGMGQSAIAKIENQDRRIDFSTMVQIADILEIPWDLLKGEKISEKKKFEQTASAFSVSAGTVFHTLSASNGDFKNFEKVAISFKTWMTPNVQSYLPNGFTIDEVAESIEDVQQTLKKYTPSSQDLYIITKALDPIRHLAHQIESPYIPWMSLEEVGKTITWDSDETSDDDAES